MTLQLGESTVLPNHPFQPIQSITKKISHYIFRFQDKIGQGNFSKVYKGYDQLTNQQVAIKIIELSSVKSAKLQQLLFSQIQVIQTLNHPNILKCYEVLKSENNCYIITQLCNGGDLQSVLKKHVCLNDFSAAPYIRDIFKGLLYLGQRGIVHRDLKVANVFLHNGVAKIADFGFAKYTNNKNFKDLDIGSPLYMSPEGMIDYTYGMKTDIWAFGIIVYELFHGKTPFCNCKTQYQLKRAVSVPLPQNAFRPDLNPQIRQLIMKCLNVNAQQRPDALSLTRDSYINRLLNGYPQNYQFCNSHTPQHFKITSSKNLQQNHTMDKSLHQQTSMQNFFTQPSHHSYSDNSSFDQTNQVPMIPIPKQETIDYANNSPLKSMKNFFHNHDSVNNRETQRGGKQKKVAFQIPQTHLQNYMSTEKFYPKSNDLINVSNSSHQQYLSPDKRSQKQTDHIFSPRELDEKIKFHSGHQINDNSSTLSNSSWSHQNLNIKKKFPKVLSSNNVNTVSNSFSSNNIRVKDALNTTVQNSVNFSRFDNLDKSYYSTTSNKETSMIHSLPGKKINKPINFNECQMSNNKKFGQIIKGDKRNQGNIKSTIKLDKSDPTQQQLEKIKSKSHIQYQPNQTNLDSQNIKKRTSRHSIGDSQSPNQHQNNQIPSFIQEKVKNSLKRNTISSIIDFKQAVAILHYCRLYFRFLITLKKLKSYPQIKQIQFKSLQENPQSVDIFSRYLLTVLNELIQNVKSKEIIYDGENYKKKQIKQDKLKEVTQEYYKKYFEDINKSKDQNRKINPIYDKSTSFEWIKELNQELWNTLDNQFTMLKQKIQKGITISENFVKHFKNLCFFSVRIVHANQILMRCIKTKNYVTLADILIQNWLGQQFYTQDYYFKAKSEYLKLINDSNPLKGSQTNDTQSNWRNDVL